MMRKIILAAALVALAVPAFAADMPVKAPPVPFQYPQANGWYGMVGTEGGGGTVSVNAPGVNTNSLVSNSINVNAGVGYTWQVAQNSSLWAALEGDIGYTNFNGATPGLSWHGPVEMDFRALISAPIQQINAFFPSFGLAMPSLSSLPAGFTAVSSRYYIAGGFDVTDNSLAFMGQNGKAWGIAPTLTPAGALVQLTNGSAADIYTKIRFNENGICTTGPVQSACGRANIEFLAGLKYKFGI